MEQIAGIEVSEINLANQNDDPYIRAFSSYFGKFEMDVTALAIVTICSHAGNWKEFTIEDLQVQCKILEIEQNYWVEGFHMLCSKGWIDSHTGGNYAVTEGFVKRCKEKTDELNSL